MNLKQIIEASKHGSKVDNATMQKLEGLSTPWVRNLLNNLVAQSDTYLEIGCYLGGTLRAALHGNDHVYAAAVDNFSMMPRKRQRFFDNTEGLTFDFFEEDCFAMDITKIKKPIKVYFYDGHHSFESQYKALTHFYDAMQGEFIYVCDDWGMKRIPNATFTAAKDLNLKVIENYDLPAGKTQWWSGIGLIKFQKP